MTSILVVDDEPVFIEALTISLEREGFGVIACLLYTSDAADD